LTFISLQNTFNRFLCSFSISITPATAMRTVSRSHDFSRSVLPHLPFFCLFPLPATQTRISLRQMKGERMPIWKRAFCTGLCSGALLLGQGVLPHIAGGQTGKPAGDVSPGKSIYESRCVACHGKEGKGNGPASALLSPRPRDFTTGKFKFRSTGTGSIPTDGDLLNTVRNGLHATAMPDWKPFIGDDSLKAVVEYVKSFSIRFSREMPKPARVRFWWWRIPSPPERS